MKGEGHIQIFADIQILAYLRHSLGEMLWHTQRVMVANMEGHSGTYRES